MDSFNKVLSFILGLVVVVVILVVITNRFRSSKSLNFLPLSDRKITITPTRAPSGLNSLLPKKKVTATPTPTRLNGSTKNNGQTKGGIMPTVTPGTIARTNGTTTKGGVPTTIPKTGSPTLLLAIFSSSLFAGAYLKKRAK
jgi:hypothetical protein